MQGVPGIYFHSLFGSRGWPQGAAETGHNRTINRRKLQRDELDASLSDPLSQQSRVFVRIGQLLKIRREQAAITSADWLDGAMLGESAFVVRYFGKENDDRLLLVNLGPELRFSPCPEPLLAPLAGKGWNAMISTEDAIYGGLGGKAMETTEGWVIPAESASFMEPDEKVELKSNEADQDG